MTTSRQVKRFEWHDCESGAEYVRAADYDALVGQRDELLEALKALLPEGWGNNDTMDHVPGVKLARLAIAKAEQP